MNARAYMKQDKKDRLDKLASQADRQAEFGDTKAVYKLAKQAAGIKTKEVFTPKLY